MKNDLLVKAIEDVLYKGVSVYKASKKYNVSKTTLISKLKDEKIKSITKELEYVMNKIQTEATLFLYDVHIPHHDKDSLETAISFAKSNYMITRIVLGGDIMDCEALSKYDKSKETVKFLDEVRETKEFLKNLRDTFKNAEIVYIIGNHEERLEKYIMKNAPELQGIADSLNNILSLDEYNIKIVDNRRMKSTTGSFYKINDFTILHGHEIGICPIVNPAHKFLEKAKDNIILGHIHSPDEKVITTISGDIIRCYSVGTLGKLYPMYKPFNSWGQGFAIMEHHKDNDIVRNFRIFNNKIY